MLDLLETLRARHLPLPLHDHFPRFAAADRGRLLRLLTPPDSPRRYRSLSPAVLRRLARSDAPELPAFSRALADWGDLAPLVKALPPARRHAFYRAAQEGRGAGHVTIDAIILAVLPRNCVAEEARRMAAVAREHGAHWSSLLLADSFLPVEEARERLVEATRRPAAEDRAEAWPLLIRNAARSGDHAAVTSVLEEMGRLRNEQDPVRSAALDALSRVRPALFTEDAEPHLDRITADAVEARDSSAATRHNLSDLALSVLREHAAGGRRELVNWALRTLVRISGNTGGADLGRLDTTLRRGQEHQVYEALRPWIGGGRRKGRLQPRLHARPRGRAARRRHARTAGTPLAGHPVRQRHDPAPRGRTVARAARDPRRAGGPRPRVRTVRGRAVAGPGDRHPAPHRPARPAARRDPSVRPLSDQGHPWTVPVDRDIRRWVPR
ncbi:hypothetical protein O1M63_48735 [Streptomyces mirabilis]|nr:hypothetical protein [Streptomyces mirabilis]